MDCPDADAMEIRAIEISFAVPVQVTQRQQKLIHDMVSDIVDAPWNQFEDGVHWPAGSGSKPQWSKADAAFLGKRTNPNAPDSGEPTFDDSVFTIESDARGFVSEEERKKKEAYRKKKYITDVQCPECGPTIIVTEYYTGQKRPECGMCCKCEETVYFAK